MKVSEILSFKAKTDKYYFFRPAGNASGRRRNEANNSFDVEADYDGNTIKVSCNWRESCSHVYREFTITVNGVKKTVRALKKLPADLEFSAG